MLPRGVNAAYFVSLHALDGEHENYSDMYYRPRVARYLPSVSWRSRSRGGWLLSSGTWMMPS